MRNLFPIHADGLGLFRWLRLLRSTTRIDHRLDIELYLISHPKSGRTWLRAMIGHALCELFDADRKNLLETRKLTRPLRGVSTSHFTHDGTGHEGIAKGRATRRDKAIYRDKKVLFLLRDPLDVVVSNYFHCTHRTRLFSVTISVFVRNDALGIDPLLRFYRVWWQNRGVPRAFELVRYEEMHDAPAACLRRVLAFMEVQPAVSDDVIAAAVRFARFDNLREMERTRAFDGQAAPADGCGG